MKERRISKPVTKKTTRARKRQTVGESIIEGLRQAVAWTKGENDDVRVTLVRVTAFLIPPILLSPPV